MKRTDRGGDLLTEAEAAKRLGLPSAEALRSVRRKGKIGYVKFGRHPRYLEEDLDRFIEEHRVAPVVVSIARGRR